MTTRSYFYRILGIVFFVSLLFIQVIGTAHAQTIAPTSVSLAWLKGGSSPPTGQYSLTFYFKYSGSVSDLSSFRLYLKRPGQSFFSAVATLANPSSQLVTSGCSPTVSSGGWNSRYCANTGNWDIGESVQYPSYYTVGNYEAYVTAIDNAGIEGPVSSILKNTLLNQAVFSSPSGAQTSLTPTFRWSVSSGWPSNAIYWVSVWVSSAPGNWSSVWSSSVSISASATEGSVVYNGSALDPSKTYYTHVWGETTGYFSMGDSVLTFTVSTPDTTPPSIPTGLAASVISSSQINLSWSASADNIGVTGYRIYRGGTLIGTSTSTSYSDTGLSPSTPYSYTVAAYDAAGNVSAQSSQVSATTLAPSTSSGSEGTVKWTFTAAVNATEGDVVAVGPDGTLYASFITKLYAIRPDGTQKWAFTPYGDIYTSPAVAGDGTIYIGTWDGRLIAVNPDGTKKWEFTTGSSVYSTPAIAPDGTIFFGADNYKFYAIDSSGNRKWDFTTGGIINSSPAIGTDGTIYFGSYDQNVYALNPNGTKKWSFLTGSRITSSPAIGSDGIIYIGSWDNKLYAIKSDGTKKWSFTTGSRVSASPIIGSDGTMYVGGYDGNVYAINSDGTKKWSFPTATANCSGSIHATTPAVGDDGTIYIAAGCPGVRALTSVGVQKWTFNPCNCVGLTDDTSFAIGNDGTVYYQDSNKLYAFYSSSSGLGNTSWPKFHKDGRNTGSAATSAAILDTTSPSIPINLNSVVVSSTQINLSWSAATDDVGIAGYKIYRNGSQIVSTSYSPLSYSDTGLTPSTSYSYTIDAYDAAGNVSSQSSPVSATTQSSSNVPNAPGLSGGLYAYGVAVNFTWSDKSTNETGFRLYTRPSSGGDWRRVTQSDFSANSTQMGITDYSMTVGTHEYKLLACNSYGCSPDSNIVSITFTASTFAATPSNLAATASGSSVALSWTDNATNETEYSVYKLASDGSVLAQVGFGLAANTTSWVHSGVAAGTYRYSVNACTSTGCSLSSNQPTVTVGGSSDTTAPSTPTGLSVSIVSSSQINLSWSASTDNVGVTGYKVYRGGTQTATATSTSYSDTGLTPSTLYSYTVVAYDAAGNVSLQSSSVSATTLSSSSATIPSPPTSLFVSGSSPTYIGLYWTDNSVNESEFRIDRRFYGGSWSQVGSVATNITTYTDNNLTGAGTYDYLVKACNSAGCSLESGIISRTIDAAAPAVPLSLMASAGTTSIVLSWTDNSTGEWGFRLKRRIQGSTNWFGLASVLNNTTGNSVSFTDSYQLVANTIYEYVVRSYNTYESADSNMVTVNFGSTSVSSAPPPATITSPPPTSTAATTTIIAADTTPPSNPTYFSANAVAPTQINLSWSAAYDALGVKGYNIYRDGNFLASTSDLLYSDTSAKSLTEYRYAIAAYDTSGNIASRSLEISVFTPDIATDAIVKITVLDSAGFPIPNISVQVYKEISAFRGGITDKNGQVLINVPRGDYKTDIYLPPDRTDLIKPASLSFSISAGDTQAITIRFESPTKYITGRVIFPDGTPVSDAEVGAYSSDTNQWTSAFVDSQGNYSLKVGRGKWQVDIKPRYPVLAKWSKSGLPQEVLFDDTEVTNTRVINITVALLGNKLTVRVIDDTGTPLSDAGIILDTVSAGAEFLALFRSPPEFRKIGTDGTAIFLVQKGTTYYIRAFLATERGYTNPEEQKIVIDSDSDRSAVLVFKRPAATNGITLRGIAKLDNASIADAFVWGWSEKGGFFQVRTDAGGLFTASVNLGERWHFGAGKEISGVAYKATEITVDIKDLNPSVEIFLAKFAEALAPLVRATQAATQPIIAQTQDGSRVSIPADSVSAATEVSLAIKPTIEAPSQPAAKVVGTVYDVSLTDQSGKTYSSLQKTIEITLPYNLGKLKELGVREDDLVPSFFDETSGTWVKVDNYTIDKEKKIAILRVNHLTRFAIVSPADVTPPAAPTNVSATALGDGKIKLAWTNPTSDFSHAKIYRSTTSGQLGNVRISEVATTTYTDTGVTNGTKYYYTVRAVDPAGNESANTNQVSVTAVGTSEMLSKESVPVAGIVDGDLIKTSTSFDIYIVKLIGGKQFKRLILNPAIFNSYGHLKWENVKTVSQSAQDSYTLADLVIEVNPDGSVFDPKVYRVSSSLNSDVGIKQWLNMTAVQFTANGYDWDAIYKINHTEASPDFYPQGTAITSSL